MSLGKAVSLLIAVPLAALGFAFAGADSPAVAQAGVSSPPPVREGSTADGLPVYRLAGSARPLRVRPTGSMFAAEYRFVWRGRARSFRVYVPTGLTGSAPTVLALHGLYQSSSTAQGMMRFQDIATARHFVVAYPQGWSSSWNAGRCCGQDLRAQVDDVSFLGQVQRYLGDIYPTNIHRRYLAGFSNGGMMAALVACSAPTQWAAVALVSAAHLSTCRPSAVSPVPFMHVHGTADSVVPYAGTRYSAFLRSPVPSVAQTNALWSSAGGPVKAVRIVGGSHEWPNLHSTAGAHYDTTSSVWDFFSSYQK